MFWVLGLLLLTPVMAIAQAPPPPPAASPDSVSTDTLFLHAQRMAAEGQGDAARALVQHELDAAPTGSPRYVEALYWRAVVAATAADAERDLRAIVIEYPLSPRAPDALLRLAQLEMTRGDNDQALAHLERVVVEHPDSPARARASFWMGRVLFDQQKPVEACRRLGDAARATPSDQVEQRNQIDFWLQRCATVDTTTAVATADSAARDSARAPAARGDATHATAGRATPSAARPQYTVQVAAYNTRAAAEKLRQNLVARGFDARVVGAAKPYRVRVGRYDTHAAAAAAVAKMRAKHVAGFVTEAEPR